MTAADEVVQSKHGDQKQPTTIAQQPARRNSALAAARWLAIAASLLVAFTLGIGARGWWPAATLSDHTQQVAVVEPAQPTAAPTENSLVASDSSNPTSSTATNSTSGKWQALKVTIPTADGQGEQTVEVPLVAAGEQEIKTLLAKQEPVLSDVALQALQSTGHEVEQHRAYYPVQLADGTQAILPMDYVEVRDTGNWQ